MPLEEVISIERHLIEFHARTANARRVIRDFVAFMSEQAAAIEAQVQRINASLSSIQAQPATAGGATSFTANIPQGATGAFVGFRGPGGRYTGPYQQIPPELFERFGRLGYIPFGPGTPHILTGAVEMLHSLGGDYESIGDFERAVESFLTGPTGQPLFRLGVRRETYRGPSLESRTSDIFYSMGQGLELKIGEITEKYDEQSRVVERLIRTNNELDGIEMQSVHRLQEQERALRRSNSTWRRHITWIGQAIIIYTAFRTAVGVLESFLSTQMQLNDAMVQFRVETGRSTEEARKYLDVARDMGQAVGIPMTEMMGAMTIAERAGLGAPHVMVAAQLQRAFGIPAELGLQGFLTLQAAFPGIGPVQLGDLFTALYRQTAIRDAGELFRLFAETSPLARQFGLGIEEYAGFMSILGRRAATREPATLQRLFRVLERFYTDTELASMVFDYTGLSTTYVQGGRVRYTPITDVLGAVSRLPREQQEEIFRQLPSQLGQQYAQIMLAAMEDFARNTEQGSLRIETSVGELDRATQTAMGSWTAATENLKAAWQELVDAIGIAEPIISFINSLATEIRALARVTREEGALGFLQFLTNPTYMLSETYKQQQIEQGAQAPGASPEQQTQGTGQTGQEMPRVPPIVPGPPGMIIPPVYLEEPGGSGGGGSGYIGTPASPEELERWIQRQVAEQNRRLRLYGGRKRSVDADLYDTETSDEQLAQDILSGRISPEDLRGLPAHRVQRILQLAHDTWAQQTTPTPTAAPATSPVEDETRYFEWPIGGVRIPEYFTIPGWFKPFGEEPVAQVPILGIKIPYHMTIPGIIEMLFHPERFARRAGWTRPTATSMGTEMAPGVGRYPLPATSGEEGEEWLFRRIPPVMIPDLLEAAKRELSWSEAAEFIGLLGGGAVAPGTMPTMSAEEQSYLLAMQNIYAQLLAGDTSFIDRYQRYWQARWSQTGGTPSQGPTIRATDVVATTVGIDLPIPLATSVPEEQIVSQTPLYLPMPSRVQETETLKESAETLQESSETLKDVLERIHADFMASDWRGGGAARGSEWLFNRIPPVMIPDLIAAAQQGLPWSEAAEFAGLLGRGGAAPGASARLPASEQLFLSAVGNIYERMRAGDMSFVEQYRQYWRERWARGEGRDIEAASAADVTEDLLTRLAAAEAGLPATTTTGAVQERITSSTPIFLPIPYRQPTAAGRTTGSTRVFLPSTVVSAGPPPIPILPQHRRLRLPGGYDIEELMAFYEEERERLHRPIRGASGRLYQVPETTPETVVLIDEMGRAVSVVTAELEALGIALNREAEASRVREAMMTPVLLQTTIPFGQFNLEEFIAGAQEIETQLSWRDFSPGPAQPITLFNPESGEFGPTVMLSRDAAMMQLRILENRFKEEERVREEYIRNLKRSRDELAGEFRGFLAGALRPTDVTALQFAESRLGLYQDQPDEIVRRARSIINKLNAGRADFTADEAALLADERFRQFFPGGALAKGRMVQPGDQEYDARMVGLARFEQAFYSFMLPGLYNFDALAQQYMTFVQQREARERFFQVAPQEILKRLPKGTDTSMVQAFIEQQQEAPVVTALKGGYTDQELEESVKDDVGKPIADSLLGGVGEELKDNSIIDVIAPVWKAQLEDETKIQQLTSVGEMMGQAIMEGTKNGMVKAGFVETVKAAVLEEISTIFGYGM